MAGVIHKIITLYEMHANEMSCLVTNTRKVFENCFPEDDRGQTTDGGRRTTAEILSSVLCPQPRPTEASGGRISDLDDTFEKKLDRDIKRMEACVKERLKPFDNAQGRQFKVKAGSK